MASEVAPVGDVAGSRGDAPTFDTSVAHIARVYNYWLGGKDNFAADRAAAEQAIAAFPDIVLSARANRAFLRRSVTYLVSAGIRQFLDIGTGIPSANNTHEVAQRLAPDCRIVYVDNDPVVLAHARALLVNSTHEGATAYLQADIRDPQTIIEQAAETLDFSKPVAIMLLGVLYMIPDADQPYAAVDAYVNAVVPGSYLAISHPASDVDAEEAARAAREYDNSLPTTQTNRTQAEVIKFFDGLELLPPGVVQLNKWRPNPSDVDPGIEISSWAGLGLKH